MLHYSGWLCYWNCQWSSVWHHKEKLHDKTRAGLPNRSKEGSASIRRSNPPGRPGGNGNVQSLRVWSHMREITESRQQIRFPLHSQFNFAELGCRSSQQVGVSILHSSVCECRNRFVLAGVEKKKLFFPYFLSLILDWTIPESISISLHLWVLGPVTSVVSFSLSLWEPGVKCTQIPTQRSNTHTALQTCRHTTFSFLHPKYFCKAKILCLVETEKMSPWRKRSQLWIPEVEVVKAKRWRMWLWPSRERTWFHTSCCAEIHIPLKGFGTFSSRMWLLKIRLCVPFFKNLQNSRQKRKKRAPVELYQHVKKNILNAYEYLHGIMG